MKYLVLTLACFASTAFSGQLTCEQKAEARYEQCLNKPGQTLTTCGKTKSVELGLCK